MEFSFRGQPELASYFIIPGYGKVGAEAEEIGKQDIIGEYRSHKNNQQ